MTARAVQPHASRLVRFGRRHDGKTSQIQRPMTPIFRALHSAATEDASSWSCVWRRPMGGERAAFAGGAQSQSAPGLAAVCCLWLQWLPSGRETPVCIRRRHSIQNSDPKPLSMRTGEASHAFHDLAVVFRVAASGGRPHQTFQPSPTTVHPRLPLLDLVAGAELPADTKRADPRHCYPTTRNIREHRALTPSSDHRKRSIPKREPSSVQSTSPVTATLRPQTRRIRSFSAACSAGHRQPTTGDQAPRVGA
jgi:hypothetical protein